MTFITVDTDGVSGDYSGLNAAFSALPGTFGDDYTILCSATTGVIDDISYFEYFNTQGAFTLTVQAGTGNAALKDGWSSSRYIARAASGSFALIETYNPIIWDGIQFTHAEDQSYRNIIANTAGVSTFRNCRFETGSTPIIGGQAVILENTIMISTNAAVTAINSTGAHTIINCDFNVAGTLTGSTTATFTNCAVVSGTLPGTGTFTYNMVTTGTWGSNSVNPSGSDWDNELVSSSTGDYTAVSGGNLNSGIGPALDSSVPVTDIEGDSRSGNTAYIGVDEITGTPSGLTVTGSDSMSMSDSSTATLSVSISGSEQLSMSDSSTATIDISISGAEQLSMADTGSADISILLSATDGVTFTDTGSQAILITLSGSDGLGIGDNGTTGGILPITGSDTLALSDSATITISVNVIGTDAVSLSEVVEIIHALTLSGTDDIDISDYARQAGIIEGILRMALSATVPNTSVVAKKSYIELSPYRGRTDIKVIDQN